MRPARRVPGGSLADQSAAFWNRHNVTHHHVFTTSEESLEYFHWRASQYPNYLSLMPVSGFDGRRVLDFGCGPGHDLVGFGVYSRCRHLAGVDVAEQSVREATARLRLHGIDADVLVLPPDGGLPFDAASFDHVHSSGVLHHVPDPVAALREIRRVLAPRGTVSVMIYNYDSVWMHLRVAYQRTLVEGLYPDEPLRDRFARSTDGDDCPVSRCFRPSEWIAICESAGFQATFAGAAMSLTELALLPRRFEAQMDRRLPAESRLFLESLRFDDQQMPLYQGHHAGIDAVYHLTPMNPA